MGEWYYIGHYGQLGPLTREQIDELVEGEVISRDTYVWKQGMSNWVCAAQAPELAQKFHAQAPAMDPPPFPASSTPSAPYDVQPVMGAQSRTYTSSRGQNPMPGIGAGYVPDPMVAPVSYSNQPFMYVALRSNKSRIAGGILQFIIPGIGRMYMGYWGIGILQFLSIPCGIGVLWSYIDAVVVLTGGVKIDGYGRVLCD